MQKLVNRCICNVSGGKCHGGAVGGARQPSLEDGMLTPVLLPKCLNSRAGDNDSVGKSVSNHEDLSSNFQHPLKKKKARHGCECLSLQLQRADIDLQRSLASQPSQNSFQFSERPCHQVIWWSVRRFYLMASTCTHMNPPTYTSNISALHIHTTHYTTHKL